MGSIGQFYLLTKEQFLICDPPRSSQRNPIQFSHLVEQTHNLLEKLFREKRLVQPRQLRFLCYSQGCLVLAELLSRLQMPVIGNVAITDISCITPAGILPEGIDRIANRLKRWKTDELWRIPTDSKQKKRWYRSDFLAELTKVDFFNTMKQAALSGVNVVILPEYPDDNTLLLPEELNLLRSLELTPRVHIVEPSRRRRHLLGHFDSDVVFLQALGVSSNQWSTFVGPPFYWPDYEIEQNIQNSFLLVLDVRPHAHLLYGPHY